MNNIITMRRLVDIMSRQSKIPAEQIDQFLRTFTSLIAEALADRQSVSISGVGEFMVGQGGRILYKPDATLARDINSPFEIFQPEELADDITVEELNRPVREQPEPESVSEHEITSEPEIAPAPEIVPVYEPEPTVEPQPEVVDVPLPEPSSVAEPSTASTLEPAPEPEPEPEPAPALEYEEEYEDVYADDYQEPKFPVFWTIIGLLVGLIIGVGVGFFMHDPIEKLLEPSLDEAQIEEIEGESLDFVVVTEPETPIEETDDMAVLAEEVAVEQAHAEPAAKPEAKPKEKVEPKAASPTAAADVKYETVKPGTSLANLAKKHYGERSYWVYIYLENQSVIKNPNRVPQGVRLVIPPLEKYATQATQAEKLEAARKKVSEVLSKYPN